jgi:HSP20 family protein
MAMCKVSASVHFVGHKVISHEAGSKVAWEPNTDMYATDDGLVIKVELAGMRSENLQIIVEGSWLHITGQRPDGCRAKKFSFLAMEIDYGPFEKVVEVPSGYDLSQARASYANGFLRVDVPVLAPAPVKHTKLVVTAK